MTVPDFMIWHCANCGAPAEGTKKPCECLTDVGVRQGPNGRGEQTFWDDPPDPRDATIATLTAALEEARGVLVASRSFVELVYEETDREEAADAKIVMGQTDAALATIDAALGRVEG